MASECPSGKSSWPELVGTDGDAAAAVIMSENPNVETAPRVKEGSSVITDFRCDRVWVWVDTSNVVTRVPQIG